VFINQETFCSAGSRILVQQIDYKKFVEAMAEKAKKIKIGPPLERGDKMGSWCQKSNTDRVCAYLEIGRKKPRWRRRRSRRSVCQG